MRYQYLPKFTITVMYVSEHQQFVYWYSSGDMDPLLDIVPQTNQPFPDMSDFHNGKKCIRLCGGQMAEVEGIGQLNQKVAGSILGRDK